MNSSKKIAVVTGGAGFIGSHMVDLLIEESYRVHVIDNLICGSLANLEKHRGNTDLFFENLDIRDLENTNKLFKNAYHIFHFAGIGDIVPSIDHPVEYMSVNVQGTVKVLEAAKAANAKKLVYAASSSCYGLAETPTSEDAPIQPQYPYALSKYQGEQAVFHWGSVYKLPVNTIRIFNAYGTRSKTSGAYGAVFGVFLAQKLANQPLTVVGDGTQKRDFIYVSDVARGFYLAANSNLCNEVYNLGAGSPQSINRLVELLDSKAIYMPKRPGEPNSTHADITKIKNELGWEPKVSFEEGVNKMLGNIDYWRSAPIWDVNSINQATKTWFDLLD